MKPIRLAILYARLGPYHVARLRAAAARGDVVAIEGSDIDRHYAWAPVRSFTGIRRLVLFEGQVVEEQPIGRIRRRVAELLGAEAPDVVVLPSWGSAASLCMLEWCLRSGVPIVMMTDSQHRDHPRSWWKESLKHAVLRHCASAFVAGRRSAEYVERLGIPPERVRMGCNVVDNRHFSAGAEQARADAVRLRAALGLPEHYVLSSGRFIESKNLIRLLRAFDEMLRRVAGDTWHLVLLGDGEQRASIEREIRRLDLSQRVHLLGFRQYEELPVYYGLAEGFVLASTRETWGLVVNEAMAAALPVVVSDACGCAPDLVEEGITGFLCRADDVTSIALALERLCAVDCDRAVIGRAGRERVGTFTPETFAAGLWRSARDAVERGAGRRAPLAARLAALMARWS